MRIQKRPQAFSIIEILIVMTLISLVSGVVAVLFTKGTQIYRHSETHIEAQRNGRHLVAMMTPYLASARNVVPSAGAIIAPVVLGTGTAVIFKTSEDRNTPGYPSNTTSALGLTNLADFLALGNGVGFVYRIRFVQDATDRNDGNVVAERLNNSVAFPDGTLPLTVTAPVIDHTRVLMFRKANEQIQDFTFTRPTRDLLQMSFTSLRNTQSAVTNDAAYEAQKERAREEFRATFSLPTDLI